MRKERCALEKDWRQKNSSDIEKERNEKKIIEFLSKSSDLSLEKKIAPFAIIYSFFFLPLTPQNIVLNQKLVAEEKKK